MKTLRLNFRLHEESSYKLFHYVVSMEPRTRAEYMRMVSTIGHHFLQSSKGVTQLTNPPLIGEDSSEDAEDDDSLDDDIDFLVNGKY